MEDRENNKNIDDEWKRAIEEERQKEDSDGDANSMPVDFGIFLSGLMFDCLVALGEIENPITKKTDQNLKHAKYAIDILGLIKEKTDGNLTDEESEVLESMLYQLRTKYISKVK